MTEIAKEAIAVTIAAMRLGFSPVDEIGFGYEKELQGMAVTLGRSGKAIRIGVGRKGEGGYVPETVFHEWANVVNAIVRRHIPEGEVQRIWIESRFCAEDWIRSVVDKLLELKMLEPDKFNANHWEACHKPDRKMMS